VNANTQEEKRRHPSIVWRLAIGLAVMTGLLWLLAAAISGEVTRNELNGAFDESMRQSALRLLPLAIHDRREPTERSENQRIAGLESDEELYAYVIRDAKGRVVLTTVDAPSFAELKSVPEGFSDIGPRRVFSLTDPRSGFNIIVIERGDHRAAALRSSISAHLLPLAALIPLIIVGIWWALRLAMRPVEVLSRDIARRGRHDLTPLPNANHPVELMPIATAVDGLLSRLRDALDVERAFAASSAHELRTPIAGALAQVQRLEIELEGNPSEIRIAEIESSLRNLSKLSEKLLQLSRLEAGFAQTEDATDLEPILKLVCRDYDSASRSANRVQLKLDSSQPLRAPVNGDAFAIAVTNLIENALKHGAADKPITVLAGPGPVIRVINRGTVVLGDMLGRLGEPFVRGETTASGTGLGLSIARSILEQTDGRLDLFSPARGGDDGFEAVMSWDKD